MDKTNLNKLNNDNENMLAKKSHHGPQGPLGPHEYFDFFGKKMTINGIAQVYGLKRLELLSAYNITSDIDEAISLCINCEMITNNDTMIKKDCVENYKMQKDAISIEKLKNFAYGSFPEVGYKNNDHTLLNNSVDPIELTENKVVNEKLREQFKKAMNLEEIQEVTCPLSERNKKIMRLYYGLEDGCMHTYGEIGRMFNICADRVRQIVLHVHRRLYHPKRLELVEDFREM